MSFLLKPKSQLRFNLLATASRPISQLDSWLFWNQHPLRDAIQRTIRGE